MQTYTIILLEKINRSFCGKN